MRRLVVLFVAGLLVLTACGDETDEGGDSGSTETTIEGSNGTATIEGEFGEDPKVSIDGEFKVDKTDVVVMNEGDGATVKAADTVLVDYHGVNGTTGEVFDSAFERGEPVEFPLDGVIPGFSKGLVDQTIGSRVVISVTPEDGYPQGTADGAIKPGDSLIFVVDLLDPEK